MHRLTAPYLELVNNGLPSPTATLSKRPTSRTEVVLNAAGSARRMSRFARTLQDWAKTQAQACEEGFAQRAENQYRAWIEGASMENPKKGVERIAFQRSISEQGTEVALAWAVSGYGAGCANQCRGEADSTLNSHRRHTCSPMAQRYTGAICYSILALYQSTAGLARIVAMP